MRILSITSTYPRFLGDGVGSFIHSISKTLSDHGHVLYVIAPDNHKAQYQWQDKVQVERIKYIKPRNLAKLGHGESLKSDIKLKWHSYILVSLFSIFTIIRIATNPMYRNVDVIYAHWILPGGLIGSILSYLLHIPLVVHLHGSDVFVSEHYKIFRPFVKYILNSASKIIACSNNLANRIKHIGEGDLEVIPYGVDIDIFFPNEKNNYLESKRDRPKLITAVGRLVNKKGFKYLIIAAEKVIKLYPQCRFQIIGDGDQRSELVELSNSLKLSKNIVFLGNIPWNQIPDILRKTDIFVLPSIIDEKGNVDGLPVVLLEAMSSGCAVIASKVAGVPDVITDGVNGILVEPKNDNQLSQAIISLISNDELRIKLGESARDKVKSDYSWDIIVKRIERVLESTISQISYPE